MSIHPQYAEAILEGRKGVEFRKRPLARDIDSVLIYATSPVQRIVGIFTISETVVGTPDEVWNKFHDVGCIDIESYNKYYANSELAVALVVEAARRFDPLPLCAFESPPTIPQSFTYLPVHQVALADPCLDDEFRLALDVPDLAASAACR